MVEYDDDDNDSDAPQVSRSCTFLLICSNDLHVCQAAFFEVDPVTWRETTLKSVYSVSFNKKEKRRGILLTVRCEQRAC